MLIRGLIDTDFPINSNNSSKSGVRLLPEESFNDPFFTLNYQVVYADNMIKCKDYSIFYCEIIHINCFKYL